MAKKKVKEKEVVIKDNYNDYIIAIDSSMSDSGVSVYSLSRNEIVYVGHCNTGNVRALKKYRGYNINAVKLSIQRDFFEDLKRRFPPRLVIFEKSFAKFKKETEAINQMNGVLYSVFWNYTQIKYAPTSVKAEIAHGKAEKEQVRDILLLNLPELEGNKLFYDNDNASDAVAVLMTHLLKTGIYKKVDWNKGELKIPLPKKRIAITKINNKIY